MEEIKSSYTKLESWVMWDCCYNRAIYLEEGQANGAWKDIRKRSLVGMIGLILPRCFRL